MGLQVIILESIFISMRFQDTTKLAKKALKQPWMYTEQELSYLRKAKRLANQAIKLLHMKGERDD